MEFTHVPVMLDQTLSLIAPKQGIHHPLMVDATLGLGGHAEAALERFPALHLIGIDRDPQALEAASKRLGRFGVRFEAHLATYDQIGEILGDRRADAILMDLGLSSLQIDAPERGFAYSADAPLSMRMDGDDSQVTAADVVNTYSFENLVRIFRVYGDEKYAARIARAIEKAREMEPFTTSARLVDVIASAIPAGDTRKGHPAKRVFQAVRMEVNDERACLERALPAGLAGLALGGRFAVLSYHSGEDRIVKQCFADACTDHVPHGLAVVPDQYQAQFTMVTRGADKPSEEEVASNPRSASARLRVIERIKEEQ